MSLEKKINSDFIQAMKDKDAGRKEVLSFIRAEMKNVAINEGKRESGLDEADVVTVLKKHQKKLMDSASQMKDAGREDLVAEAQAELKIVSEYLPEMMSEDKISELVAKVMEETGAATMKDMGNVMKEVLEQSGGCADNKLVSQIVRAKLN